MNSFVLEVVPLQPANLTMKIEKDIFKKIQVNANLIQSIETSITDFKEWQEHANFENNSNRKINVALLKKPNLTVERDNEHNSKSRDCSEINKFPTFRMLHMSPSINKVYTAGSFGTIIHKTSSLRCNFQQSSSFKLKHKFVNSFYKSQLFMRRLSFSLTLSNVCITSVLFKKIFSLGNSCVQSTCNIKALQENITALLCKANICVDIFSPNSIDANLMVPPAIKEVAEAQIDSKSKEITVNGRVCKVNCHGDLEITLKNDCDTKNNLNSMITKVSSSTKKTQNSIITKTPPNSILRNETAFKNMSKSYLSTVIEIKNSDNKLVFTNKDQSRITMPSKMNETMSAVIKIINPEDKLAVANKDEFRNVGPSKINEKDVTISTIIDSENILALANKDEFRINRPSKINEKIETVTANKKRPAPDFDTHKAGEVKKQKIDESQSKSSTTYETEKLGSEEHRDNTDPKWQDYKVNNISDALNFMMNQWHVSHMSDPHVDLTARFNNSEQVSKKSKISPQFTIACTSLFDKRIDRVDNDIYNMQKKIDDLYDKYYDYKCNYRAQCRINSLIQRYTKEKELLENEYANLCDVRHEVAQFYKFYNAQLISQYQKSENDCQRNAILRNYCSTFVAMQRKISTIKLGQILLEFLVYNTEISNYKLMNVIIKLLVFCSIKNDYKIF